MSILDDARKLRPIVEQAMQSVEKVEAIALYPHWTVGVAYLIDFKVQYGDRLYKVIQAHTSQADWTPDITASLYAEINETADGTLENPIPYNNNMALEQGKYYIQHDVIYLCTRDTINPVYNDLKDLVNLYVEII